MLVKRIASTAEKVFIVTKAGENLLRGRPVCIHFDGTDDGLMGYTANAEVDSMYVVGIADKDIPSGGYGLVQCYGFRSDVYTINDSAAGLDSMTMYGISSASSGCLVMVSSIMGELTQLPNFAGAHSVALPTSDALRRTGVFIRCM